MEQIIEIIVAQLAIWAPSLIAILGVVSTTLGSLSKAKNSWNELKNDTDFKAIKEELRLCSQKNAELVKYQKMLLDEITKIKGYAEHKEAESGCSSLDTE